MVVTSNDEFARKVRMLRDWGGEKKYQHVLKGYNMRLETLQAAVLRVKLRHLEAWTEGRRAAAARYNALFAKTAVAVPTAPSNVRHVYHIYATRSPCRETWQAKLQALGIATGIHYPTPVHLLPAYADLGYEAGAFPSAEQASNEVLSLPMYPELTSQMQAEVAEAVIALQSSPVG